MTRYIPTGSRNEGLADYDEQRDLMRQQWQDNDQQEAEKRAGRQGMAWIIAPAFFAILYALWLAAPFIASLAEAKPAACANYPHECAAAVSEAGQ